MSVKIIKLEGAFSETDLEFMSMLESIFGDADEDELEEDMKADYDNHISQEVNNGGTTGYYDIPEYSATLDDLIEYKQMSFGRGNMFKAIYRLGEKNETSEVYDLNKIIYYAHRRLAELGIE